MLKFIYIVFGIFLGALTVINIYSNGKKGGKVVTKKGYNSLTELEKKVILEKGTELPFSGKYNNFFKDGVYHCKLCGAPLYKSDDKFKSSCGWPSFDDEIEGAIERKPDKDGRRTEILCAKCGAHLGHVFKGEGYTDKNIRHCVNSVSLNFTPVDEVKKEQTAYFAGGCFWGVEYHFEKYKGVKSAISGYMGGVWDNPTYQDVCYEDTGHLEVVKVVYDPNQVTYEELVKLFFEIHDPTQKNGQGPDLGEQYSSAIFYQNKEEKEIIEKLIKILKDKKYDVVTKVIKVDKFWKAEEYHQDYYEKNRKTPYCHSYTKRF